MEPCGAQTAELLLVTAVLHLPQTDTHAALEHHFISTGSADSILVATEGNLASQRASAFTCHSNTQIIASVQP